MTNKVQNSIRVLGFLLLAMGFLIPRAQAQAAAIMSFSPSSQSLNINDNINVTIKINTGGENINQAKAVISFPAGLEYVTHSKSGSFVTNWISEPTGGSGPLTFAGGLASPGVSGTSLTLATVTFKAKSAGTANLTFTTGSYVYRDVPGSLTTTDILSLADSSGASYSIGGGGGGSTPTPTPTPGNIGSPQNTPTPTPKAPTAGSMDSIVLLALGLIFTLFGGLSLAKLRHF